ncbi:hypothetical protein AMTRI_Chr08g205150 [Amborella trichopoda]
MIESWGSHYYSNDGGKFYALSHLYLIPKDDFAWPVFVEISEKEFFGVDWRVIKTNLLCNGDLKKF